MTSRTSPQRQTFSTGFAVRRSSSRKRRLRRVSPRSSLEVLHPRARVVRFARSCRPTPVRPRIARATITALFLRSHHGQRRHAPYVEIAPPPDDAEVAQVLIHRVRLERPRQRGSARLGLALWRQLQVDACCAARVDHAEADVPWSRVAAVLAINRVCAPGSALAIEARWYPTTAWDALRRLPDGAMNGHPAVWRARSRAAAPDRARAPADRARRRVVRGGVRGRAGRPHEP